MTRAVVERFVEQSPMAIMTRLMLQCAMHDDWPDTRDDAGGEPDDEPIREALFARAVDAIAAIVARARTRSDAGGSASTGGAAVAALHDAMSRLRAGWGRALVKDSAELLQPIAAVRADERGFEGMRLRVLEDADDGWMAAPDAGDGGRPRDAAARERAPDTGARVLPVYDPDLGLIVDLLPVERGRQNARAFVAALLETVRPGELWIVDGGFDADAILSGWPRRGGALILREHGRASGCRPLGAWREAGACGDGLVYEQPVAMAGDDDAAGALRRIEWRRARADGELAGTTTLLTDLSPARFDAVQIVQLSRRRWRDALPLPLAPVREGAPFGDAPARASLLACGIAALAYNAFSMMTQVIGAALDLDARNAERLPAHIADGVTAVYAGMMVALPPDWWRRYDQLPATTLGQLVRLLAVHVDPRSERRKRRDRLSAKSQALLRAATLERLLHDDGDDAAANVFSLRTIAMGTRDFSSNPSKALRHAGDALVMVTKYNRPIALLVSIDDWNRLLGEVRETSLTRLTFECAMAPQAARTVGLTESSPV